MKESEFEIKILIKQNLALASQLQIYKQENIKLKGREGEIFNNFNQLLHTIFSKIQDKSQIHLNEFIQKINNLFNRNQQPQQISILLSTIKQINQQQNRRQIHTLIYQQKQDLIQNQQLNYQQLKIKYDYLSQQNQLLRRRNIIINTTYDIHTIERIITNNEYLCYCGGMKLNYLSKTIEEIKQKSFQMRQRIQKQKCIKQQTNNNKIQQNIIPQNNPAYNNLLNKYVQTQKKLHLLKISNKLTLDTILQSQPYKILKNQYKQLMLYNSELIGKLKNSYMYLEEIQKERLLEIEGMDGRDVIVMGDMRRDSVLKDSEIVRELENIYALLRKGLEGSQKEISPTEISKETPKDRLQQWNQNTDDEYWFQTHRFLTFFLSKIKTCPFDAFCQDNEINYNSVNTKLYEIRNKMSQLRDQYRSVKLKHKQRDQQIEYLKKKIQKYKNRSSQKSNSHHKKHKSSQITSQKINFQKILKHLQQIQYRLSQLQFQTGQKRVNQTLIKSKQKKIRQSLQYQLSFWKDKSQQVQQIIDNKINLLGKIQCMIIDFKKDQGQYIGQIQRLKIEVEIREKRNEILKDQVERLIEERVRGRIEKEGGVGVGKEMERELIEARVLIEDYRRKVECGCGRGHLASVGLGCHHIICKECLESVISTRKRCCPICQSKFSQKQVFEIKFH